ncbi:5-oxoprolinase subunit PxpB [Flavicella sediminum]|uniref:5-oxoprolinase subunit PxpB n=1 Tax=Flavicella sediminum TaxID=2585141 RepID=UPI0011201325|nr:5-oxoprolinase subunit PxpB [Flavicella sediminum]
MLKCEVYGDSAVLLTFSEGFSEEIHTIIVNYTRSLKEKKIEGIVAIIPAFTTITISYDAHIISFKELKALLLHIPLEEKKGQLTRLIEIPVCYDTEFGKDFEELILHTGLTKEEIISLHTAPEYLVYMLGFTPGFFYLGGLDEKLFCPRKANPRMRIEEGAVGIGGQQTGVYSVASPGGWQIIGKTPVKIFDKTNLETPFKVQQGDRIKFVEISLEEYKNLKHD